MSIIASKIHQIEEKGLYRRETICINQNIQNNFIIQKNPDIPTFSLQQPIRQNEKDQTEKKRRQKEKPRMNKMFAGLARILSQLHFSLCFKRRNKQKPLSFSILSESVKHHNFFKFYSFPELPASVLAHFSKNIAGRIHKRFKIVSVEANSFEIVISLIFYSIITFILSYSISTQTDQ